jgi:hypothetical protein
MLGEIFCNYKSRKDEMLTGSFGFINLRIGGEDAGVPAASIGGSILTPPQIKVRFFAEPAWSEV